ncbi:hypothetical protein BT69DRAFT_1348657 [Atractiella rhizophila]|nr:hypothetical protein BT69DRAFT_1348657 [Atractiella rhizophila]
MSLPRLTATEQPFPASKFSPARKVRFSGNRDPTTPNHQYINEFSVVLSSSCKYLSRETKRARRTRGDPESLCNTDGMDIRVLLPELQTALAMQRRDEAALLSSLLRASTSHELKAPDFDKVKRTAQDSHGARKAFRTIHKPKQEKKIVDREHSSPSPCLIDALPKGHVDWDKGCTRE